MSIVSDASPVISLLRIGKLHLLRDLYGEIILPEAVWRETAVEGGGHPGAEEIKKAPWIKTHAATNRDLVKSLRQELDAGEAEAIALALEIKAELLLMDERLRRDSAHHLGLRCTGLIGVLIEAKRKGLIPALKPDLDALHERAGFRVRDALYSRILEDEGEA